MHTQFEFDLTESCVDDMEKYFKKRQLSEKDWENIEYKCKLESQNLSLFGKFWRSEKLEGISNYHIRKIRIGYWRLLFLVKPDVNVLYGLGFWKRADAYSTHENEILLKRVKLLDEKLSKR